ncbi:MAG TPA: phosphoribosyltransferase family protein [Dehalococcoidia bacterium]|jgi:ComF family protein
MTVLERASRVALDLLFPPACAICDRAGALVCHDCTSALPRAAGQRCVRCWMPERWPRDICDHCDASPPSFASARAACVLDGDARRLVHLLKYEGLTSLAAPMAILIADAHPPDAAIDLVVPVPLYRSRERARGYNQAAVLARALASRLSLPFDGRAARRTRNTAPLVKTMHREERLEIVRDAFSAALPRVDARHILLVDDVMTTGATLDACARALLDARAASVRCVTFARAD